MLPTTYNSRSLMLLEQKEHITKQQHEQMLNAVVEHYNSGKPTHYRTFIMERDYMFLLSLWNSGARISDVCEFVSSTIDTYSKEAKFIINKRSKKDKDGNIIKPYKHTIPLDDQYILAFHNYVNKWDISGFLFTSYKQRDKGITEQTPLTTRHAREIVYKYAEMCNLDINPHMYRHGIAVEMLNNQVPLEIISKFLGHASIETTVQFYAKITPDVMRNFIWDKMRIN